MNVPKTRGTRSPNNRTLYVWDENLMFDIEIGKGNRSAFYNWAIRQKTLREEFKVDLTSEKKKRIFK